MNFLEALRAVRESNGKLWAAPGHSTGWGITWREHDWVFVPDDFGGSPLYIPLPQVLFDVWRVGTPSEILAT